MIIQSMITYQFVADDYHVKDHVTERVLTVGIGSSIDK